ncbi:MAG: PEP-CTERM sorting domain-containing protein [Planctomycetota bacterium]|nr:PEP-CTERM sorting domain-containing protein [Planctomycetota bacterium]
MAAFTHRLVCAAALVLLVVQVEPVIASIPADYVWTTAASGIWNLSDNWTPSGVPGDSSSDTATISITGTPYTVTLDTAPTIAGFTLNSDNAIFLIPGGTLTVNGPSAIQAGEVQMDNGTWAGSGTLTNDATLRIRGSVQISAPLTQNGQVTIQGDGTVGGASLNAASSFQNSGVITLTSTGGGYPATLSTTSLGQTLTNTSAGLLQVLPGAGGPRYLTLDLTNDGTVQIDATTSFNRNGATFTNNGSVQIASGQTLEMNAGNQTFTHNAGADLDFNSGSAFSLGGGIFNHNGGTLSGTPRLQSSTLNIGSGVTTAADFLLWGACVLTGDVASAQTLTVAGDGAVGPASLNAASSFQNSGVITLTSTGGPYGATLSTSPGQTLTNASAAFLKVLPGAGGPRYLTLDLTNEGTLYVGTTTYFDRSGATLTNSSTGRITGPGNLVFSGTTLVNNGTVAPGASPGTLTITGDYNQSATAVLEIEIGGLAPGTDYDTLVVTGTALLDGTVDVSWYGPYVASKGDTFDVLTASGGITDNGIALALADAKAWQINWLGGSTVTTLQLEYVPEPATLSLLAVGGALLALRRRR